MVRLGNRHVPKALSGFIDFATACAKQMFADLPGMPVGSLDGDRIAFGLASFLLATK
jgi:hypothetical protein